MCFHWRCELVIVFHVFSGVIHWLKPGVEYWSLNVWRKTFTGKNSLIFYLIFHFRSLRLALNTLTNYMHKFNAVSLWHTSIGSLTLPDLQCSLMESYQGSSVIQTLMLMPMTQIICMFHFNQGWHPISQTNIFLTNGDFGLCDFLSKITSSSVLLLLLLSLR